jgi:hypothetical protein
MLIFPHVSRDSHTREETVYTRPSTPLSIGGVIDDAIKLYRETFSSVWPLALAGAILSAIPSLFLRLGFRGAIAGNPQAAVAMIRSPGFWGTYAVIVLVYLTFFNAFIAYFSAVVMDQTAVASKSLGLSFRRLPRAFLTTILLSVILFLASLLLLVPAIYLAGALQLTFVALVVENAGPIDSMFVSQRVVKGHWWRSVTIYSVAVIMLFVLYLVLGAVNGVLAVFMGRAAVTTIVISDIIAVISSTFLMPLFPAVLVTMYYDLKLRKEGADLASRVNALTPQ